MKVNTTVLVFLLLFTIRVHCAELKAGFGGQYGITTPDTERIEGGVEFTTAFDFMELPLAGITGGKSGSTTFMKAFGGARIVFFDHIGLSGKFGYIKSSANYSSTYYGTDISLIAKITETFSVIPFVEYNYENNSQVRTVYFGLRFTTVLSDFKSSGGSDESDGSTYAY
ncbi:MAG: hypothetical protein JXA66_05470 [Oligoflexia bacterium]|nr:hypothetical protein [Oligoflexia bacterium]